MNSYKVPYSAKGAVDTARCASCSAPVDLLVLVGQSPVRTADAVCARYGSPDALRARGGFLSVQLYAEGTMAVRP